LEAVRAAVQSAADELVRRGAIGVAARLNFPKRSGVEDLVIASGHRDRECSVELDGGELFAVASQSKMFAAAAVLLLANDGLVNLSDPVALHVPNVPAVDETATIEQFLNHTSGIGNFIHALTSLPFPWPTLSYDDIMAMARLHGRQFPAGGRLEYNNTDVVVLARLCERVSGLRFEQFLLERIFRPLALDDTFAAVPAATFPRSRMARGYYRPSQGYAGPPLDVSALPDYSIASAAGNIVSSLRDMCRWARSIADGPNAIGLRLDDFTTSIADTGKSQGHWFFPRTYARGVERWQWGGRQVWGHRGSFFGYHSGTFIEPRSGFVFSMAMTMCTEGSFMRFIDLQGHDYMSFMQTCCVAGVDALELP
jgi:CubicO group peptidase (beta-lactamase class C family)